MRCLGLFLSLVIVSQTIWAQQRYGEAHCKDVNFSCRKIKRGESWAQMFPNPVERDIVKRVNRMNIFLEPDMIIAIPKRLAALGANDVAPFATNIPAEGEKMIKVDKALSAFAAYDADGHLLKWGPISAGTLQCLDVREGCTTPVGRFRVIRKEGEDCVSKSWPYRINGSRGGGEMPWCMYFYKGFALHGSSELPGYEASAGCLRLFTEDAQWLNEHFVDLPGHHGKGTLVVIQ